MSASAGLFLERAFGGDGLAIPGSGIRERGISLWRKLFQDESRENAVLLPEGVRISGYSAWRLFVPAHGILAPSGKFFPDISKNSGTAEGGIVRVNFFFSFYYSLSLCKVCKQDVEKCIKTASEG